VDRCDDCRFDASLWTREDLERTLPMVPLMVRHALEGSDRSADVLAPLAEPSGDVVADVHRAWHLLSDYSRLRYAGEPAVVGVVEQVSVSPGGGPKLLVLRAAVTARGVSGDKQATRKHHGRPWQAVCLWSAEVVDGLAAEGHPIGYGCAGENLTVRGIPWAEVRPGVRLAVGSALVEVTAYAIPCQKNARWFSDGRFRRMAHEVRPGTSRVYAKVLVDGVVAPGDPAVREPGGVPAQWVPVRQPALF
jgi:MOSC domain-containing protein YiiM